MRLLLGPPRPTPRAVNRPPAAPAPAARASKGGLAPSVAHGADATRTVTVQRKGAAGAVAGAWLEELTEALLTWHC